MNSYELRGLLFDKDLVMSFAKTGMKSNGKVPHATFNDGPMLYIENSRIDSIFNVLKKMQTADPTVEDFKLLLSENGVPESSGLFLVDTGARKGILSADNLCEDASQFLVDCIELTDTSESLLLTRVAKSQAIKISVLTFSTSKEDFSYFSGIHDTLNPINALTDDEKEIRSFKQYKAGLIKAGHFATLAIEEVLDMGLVPEYMHKREVKFWRGSEYVEKSKIQTSEFIKFKYELIKKYERG